MSESQEKIREAFLEDLSALVDGDEGAFERWEAAMAEDSVLQDLLFEAQNAREALQGAGADYVPLEIEALEAAVFAQLERAPEERAGSDEATEQAETETRRSLERAKTLMAVEQPEARAEGAQEPALNAPTPIEQASKRAPSQRTRWSARQRWMGAGGVVAAAAAAMLWFSAGATEERGETEVIARADHALSARVHELVGNVGAGDGLAVIRDAAAEPLSVDAEITPGSVIRTDAQTRASLLLSDGSLLVINQDSELVFREEARTIELRRGELVADIAHLEAGPSAKYLTSAGEVEVLGTKFVLSASGEDASIRVTRGRVRVSSEEGSVEVGAGEEGVMHVGDAPRAIPAIDLAGSLSWSHLETGEIESDELPALGIGELRAHLPGEREEQERELSLAHHGVTIRIAGNVARTTVSETFRNESDDILEGVFRFPLPPDARIASLALKVDGRWEEGAFVSKERARQIWAGVIRNATPIPERRVQEEFIWVPGPWRDPALLEWQQGGQFELRIYPIPANGEREIRLTYEQTVQPHADGRRYTYPLAHSRDGSTRVGHFEVDARIAGQALQTHTSGYTLVATQESADEGAARLRYSEEDFSPRGDLIIDYQSPETERALQWWTFQGAAVAAPAENTREDLQVAERQRQLAADTRPYAMFALRPELPRSETVQQRDYVILVDSSQSMVGERYTRATRLSAAVIGEMDRRDRVLIVACDLTCQAQEGDARVPNGEAAQAAEAFLGAREPAGSSNLVTSVASAIALAREKGMGQERALQLVYLGDGNATMGHRRAGSIEAELREQALSARIITVGIGQDADSLTLGAMARAGGGVFVPYAPGTSVASAAMSVLEATYGSALRDLSIELPRGLVARVPEALPTIAAGHELVFAARMDAPEVRGDIVLRGKIDGEDFEARYPVNVQVSTAAGNAFVPRVWASKQIEALELKGLAQDVPEVVALSRGFGVMSRHTSLLVLESEAMFRAFRVDRARPTIEWTGEEMAQSGSVDAEESAAEPMGGLSASSRSARRPAPRVSAAVDQLADAAPAAEQEAPAERPEAARRRQQGPPLPPTLSEQQQLGRVMRRVRTRVGNVSASSAPSERDREAVIAAEARLREEPDSRDRHRALVRALSRAGQLERAEEVARQWLGRDRLDPEALIYLSDAIGRSGRREEALRFLSGVVDLDPDNELLQERMIAAYERAGMVQEACGHRVALAESEKSEDAIAAAMRCETSLGRGVAAARLLELAPLSERDAVQRAAGNPGTPSRVTGQFTVEATWSGPEDIDVSIITPQGTRLSWMGGRTNVVGEGAKTIGRERVGLRTAQVGNYLIEVNRVGQSTLPIQGQIEVQINGSRQRLPFTLLGARQMVAAATSSWGWRTF